MKTNLEFKEKKTVSSTAKPLIYVTQYLCISNVLAPSYSRVPSNHWAHQRGLHTSYDTCLAGYLSYSQDLIREKEETRQPIPLLTWNKMSSPFRRQRIIGLAKNLDSTVMNSIRGLESYPDQSSNHDSITDSLCDLGPGIWPPCTFIFFSTKMGTTKDRAHTVAEM